MILTVTLNSAVDRVLFVDELLPGGPMEALKEVTCVGGKGLDASVALSGLDQPTVALSFLAGDVGRQLEGLIKAYGITCDAIWVDGETRINYVIAEGKTGRISHIKRGGIQVHPDHISRLRERFIAQLKKTDFVILAGSIPDGTPPDLCAELIRLASEARVPVLFDSSTLSAPRLKVPRLDILKQNRDEFNSTFGFATKSFDDLEDAARQVHAEFALNALVITCGKDGILAVRPGMTYRVVVPPQVATNAAGAGDAASAGLAWRLSKGDTWEKALRWCGAVSASAVLTEATGEVRMADVESIYPLVRVVTTG